MNYAIILLGLLIMGILLLLKLLNESCCLKNTKSADDKVFISRDKILIYGDSDIIKNIKDNYSEISKNAIFTDTTSINKEWTNIYCVVAVSKSDSNNILFCNLVKKFYGSIEAFGICNETINRKLFTKNKICIVKMESFFDEYIEKG